MSSVVAFTPDGVVEVSWSTPADGVAKARRRDGVWVLVVAGREYPLRTWVGSDAELVDLVAVLDAEVVSRCAQLEAWSALVADQPGAGGPVEVWWRVSSRSLVLCARRVG